MEETVSEIGDVEINISNCALGADLERKDFIEVASVLEIFISITVIYRA
jgi:hypothetical protein